MRLAGGGATGGQIPSRCVSPVDLKKLTARIPLACGKGSKCITVPRSVNSGPGGWLSAGSYSLSVILMWRGVTWCGSSTSASQDRRARPFRALGLDPEGTGEDMP